MRDHRVIELDVPATDGPPSVYQQRRDRLANQVRSLYCICYREYTGDVSYGVNRMPAWDGDPEGVSGRRTQNIWPKIATKIMELQADPFHYVRSQFYAHQISKPPAPNTFLGETAVTKYEAFKLQARRDLEHRVSSDWNQLQIHLLPFTVNLGWDYTKALDYAIRSPQCGASPLIRYCAAAAYGLPVAAEIRERALMQYMFQMSDYDDVLQGRIPLELKTEAQQLSSSIVGW